MLLHYLLGGLTVLSESVLKICLEVEKRLRFAERINDGKLPAERDFLNRLNYYIITKYLQDPTVFSDLEDHIYDHAVQEIVHNRQLFDLISTYYARIRLYSWSKQQTVQARGNIVCQHFTKYILFCHQ